TLFEQVVSRALVLSWQIDSAESVEAPRSIHPHPLRDADGCVPPVLGQTQLSHQSRRRAFRRTDPRFLGAYSSDRSYSFDRWERHSRNLTMTRVFTITAAD